MDSAIAFKALIMTFMLPLASTLVKGITYTYFPGNEMLNSILSMILLEYAALLSLDLIKFH
jgi:VIT1/CCC1 family predicted Fe2+/Mn2+ transporter